ncbi:MAG: transposase [bacterium]
MRKLREAYKNAIYHVYNQGINRENILIDVEDNEYFVWLLFEVSKKFPLHIFCFTTMLNHYHCLLQTLEPDISKVMWHVGYHLTRFINRKYRRIGPLCRNRFQGQLVLRHEYFRNVVSYIHNNPLEAGIITDIYESHPRIITSFHDLAGITAKYPWLAKRELFKILMVDPDSENLEGVLWKPIDQEAFHDFTVIETHYQKIKSRTVVKRICK